ncbi:uncharacterized protein NECHADRAFT_87211 [Fusarium vanettenii 77-13-4]|uniref:Short chain dehydrogenase n=1 Tax=Fusarium vanettenii (strain ATCC MYA-4622 / CBS 123669 / FGSC 9596 / NRRL 45880 / 77-13-4) TaxID=660122 RepID=C7ZIP0_FUSV7|nr:uncharacterized protein NECHADRAFT_87211 [Fusarium vanettenii 77-13-4]EEU36121.1 hypothetical protein NECHADRAFT_87211 [Fusarium vanettenii 77-13-4]
MANILVTGANRGIGYAIVQTIASRLPTSNIILACRSTTSAEEAIQTLRSSGLSAGLDHVDLDIDDNASIEAAVAAVDKKYGSLDVLINNAANVEWPASDSLTDIRSASNSCYNNVITSNAIVTKAFSHLLRNSEWPRVIMISSARGSVSRTANKELPPVANMDYCIAKAGLNMLTLQLQLAEVNKEEGSRITYWAVSPGHCKTAFNGYRGKKDPLEGAESVIRLLETKKGEIEAGTFWEYENGAFQQVPWMANARSMKIHL